MSIETLDIGIIRTHPDANKIFEQQIQSTGIPSRSYTIELIDYNNPPHRDFDVMFAIFDDEDILDEFVERVAQMKLVCHIPTVVAVIPESRESDIIASLAFFPADKILKTPLSQTVLSSEIHTLMAVHDIQNKRSIRFRKRKPLGSILVENQIITSAQLSEALEYAENEKIRTGQAIIELGMVPEHEMARYLSAQLTIPLAGTKEFSTIERSTADLITESFASHNLCIPFRKESDKLFVALGDPKDVQLLDRLRDITECTIIPYLGIKSDIITAIKQIYHSISTEEETVRLFEKHTLDFSAIGKNEPLKEDESDEGIIRLVKLILTNAQKERASDIHIEPREKELVIRYRVDGVLRRVMMPPANSASPLLVRLKIMGNLDIAERRRPQDGRFVIRLDDGSQLDARLSILPTVFGEKAVIRLLDSSSYGRTLASLGFSDSEYTIFQRQLKKPHGLIVITGPTGSGKTTTLYAALQELCDDTLNIISVEDPVEYTMEEITQVQVKSEIGLTFAAALRSILRQDPDVVMIGEIRDSETADIAVKMALTGHLVFATLHTNNAPAAITRFIDIGIPPLLLSSCLNLVAAQRLVRRICPHCRVERSNSERIIEHLDEYERPTRLYSGEGCIQCRMTGYSGRIGLYELMEVTPAIQELILKNAPEQEIRSMAIREGMKTLYQSGLQLVNEGVTSLEQILTFSETMR